MGPDQGALPLTNRTACPRGPASCWAPFFFVALALALPAGREARAQGTLPDGFADVLVTGALDFPVGFAFVPPGGRVLVVEQKRTRIRLLVNGALAATDPVTTLPDIQTSGTEQGLLGIAVDPGWPARPYIYVHCDNAGTSTIRISRYTVGGDVPFISNGSLTVDPASRYDLLNDAPDQAQNHNGGTLRFGLDGMLYASLGEDAAQCAAQDLVSLRGVILRLDVSNLPAGPGGPAPRALITPADNPFVGSPNANTRLVWAFGLRNPFRFQVDSFDGSLWVGDVGESAYEELDHVAAGGHNFGWPAYEALAPHGNSCSGVVRGDDPVYSYSRAGFTASVIGAGTYRRPAGAPTGFPIEYEGNLFVSDYYIGFLRRLVPNGATWNIAPPVAGQPAPGNWGQGFSNVSDWAVGSDGALWYCRQANASYQAGTGAIRRIEPQGSTGTPPPRDAPVEFQAPYPSPAQGVVNFAWVLPRVAHVELTLHDVGGRRVRQLIPRELESTGLHGITWTGTDDHGRAVRPGIYIVRLVADGRVHERRFPLLR